MHVSSEVCHTQTVAYKDVQTCIVVLFMFVKFLIGTCTELVNVVRLVSCSLSVGSWYSVGIKNVAIYVPICLSVTLLLSCHS